MIHGQWISEQQSLDPDHEAFESPLPESHAQDQRRPHLKILQKKKNAEVASHPAVPTFMAPTVPITKICPIVVSINGPVGMIIIAIPRLVVSSIMPIRGIMLIIPSITRVGHYLTQVPEITELK